MDREMYVTQVIPTLLKKIEYFAGQPKAFFTTPSEEIAGGVPYALLYEDFFDFVTMVRSVPYASKKVTREEISEFVSAMNQSGATRGIFITTSSFDSHTMEYYKDPRVKRRQVAIVNGVDLADLFTLSDYDISEYRTAGE
jgi:restriction endonuclease Mrr